MTHFNEHLLLLNLAFKNYSEFKKLFLEQLGLFRTYSKSITNIDENRILWIAISFQFDIMIST